MNKGIDLMRYILIILLFGITIAKDEYAIPAHTTEDVVIKHEGYIFCYSERYEQSRWVAYQLTRQEVSGKAVRSGSFIEDPLVFTGTANKSDYIGSGYDRGHLAPAGDMRWSKKVMRESFLFSNMSPQHPSFNRGIWKKLENNVRRWARSQEF